MSENVFGSIVITFMTIAFFVIGINVPEVAAVAVITGIISIYSWCVVFRKMDERKKSVKTWVKKAGNVHYLVIECRNRSIWLQIEEQEYNVIKSYGI